MNFYSAYLRTLFWKPQDAIVAMYWWCTGRKVRARNRLRMVARESPFAYQMWIDTTEREQDKAAQAGVAMAEWQVRPRITIVLYCPAVAGSDDLLRLLASLDAQSYPYWDLVVVPDKGSGALVDYPEGRSVTVAQGTDNEAEALTLGIEHASGDYILLLTSHTILPAGALFRYVEALQSAPGASVVYGDHDQIDARGNRSLPWFKPQWNAEMFLAQDYVSAACLIRTDAARRALPIAPKLAHAANYALLLAVTAEDSAQVVNVPHIQSHTLRTLGQPNQAARLEALNAHLAKRDATAQAGRFGTLAVAWPLPENLPLVSIMIPTRDHAKLLSACLTSLLNTTRYRPYEVLVIDNGSVEPETLAYLTRISQDPRVRVLRYDRPYNYSAINNFAATYAHGSYLCLLNNDTEVLDEGWLTELMRQAVRPEIGAAGAKLLYGDGTIQHAGVVVGLGEAAGHAHRFQRNDDPGYFSRAHVTHYASAVTAACLVVSRAKFEAVGGLDEVGLPIAFNDVDLCLKLERAGWRNVYVPRSVLIHHESKSRGKDSAPAHIERYRQELAVLQARWGTKTYNDPLHHPHLDRSSESYMLRL